MLAQLEASEGNTQKAVSMAEEAVRLLEGVGAADAATARGILHSIRARASGEAPSSSPLSRELAEILKKNSLAPQEEALSETDKAIASAREQGDSSREIMFLLARSILSWNASDVRGCDDSLQQAKETLERAPEDLREELRGMVDQLKSQRSQVSHAQQAESVRLSEEAHRQFQAGDVETAIRSSEASLAASRKEGSQDHVAMSLLALGQMLLVADRVDEAVERLSEGLDVAPELDDADILKAMRAAAESAASARKLQKELETPLDQALEEAGSQEAQAQVLLTRAMALAAREPLEAEPLARRAHELAGRCGMKQLEVAALQARGMIFRALGRNKESDELLQQARQQAEDAGLTSMASSIEEIIEQPIQRDP